MNKLFLFASVFFIFGLTSFALAATETTVGNKTVLTFTTSENWTVPDDANFVEYLVVAGGGGGGREDGGGDSGGGGGAGGLLTGTMSVTSGEIITVTVGS